MNEEQFNAFFYQLTGCELAVPDFNFYYKNEKQCTAPFGGDKTFDIMSEYILAPVFKYTFMLSERSVTMIFSFRKDIVNAFEVKAWKFYGCPESRILTPEAALELLHNTDCE